MRLLICTAVLAILAIVMVVAAQFISAF